MPQLTPLDRESVTRMYLLPSSTLDVARHFGVNPETIRTRLIGWGVPRHPQKNLPRPQPNKARKMEQNGFWNGGKTVDKSGYLLEKQNDHPDANHLGYVRVHRLVMEKKLGRRLKSGEVVHHIDGDRQNNAPENLEVFASNAEHLAATLRGKCPNWSEQGYQRLLQIGLRLGQRSAAIQTALRAYAEMHSETPLRFLAALSLDERRLCRMAVELGRYEPLVQLKQERETIQRDWLAQLSPGARRLWGRKLACPH